jgi:HK97 family phage portal protein
VSETEQTLRAVDPRPGRLDQPRRRRPLQMVQSVFTNGFNYVSNAVGGLTKMVFRRYPSRMWNLAGTRRDYLREVGDGTSSSTVAAVLNWIARTFPEAPPTLWQELDNGQEEQVRQHPMLQILRRPNSFYNGVILWMATVVDYVADGNAYWIKIRDNGGRVVELWWTPSWMMEPKGDENNFITSYCYTIDGVETYLPVDDVVHFRFGLDPNDPKKGSSQLKSVLREVFTDDEAANFTASLLTNMGVPGLVVSPEKGTTLQEGDAEAMKLYVKDKFGGDRRGEALVMTGATQIAQFGFSPEQLLLRELRRIPEERVSAVTGIPAIVVGFGAGLERSTFTNMGEARAAAYEAGLIPMQRIMAEDVLFQLMTDFAPEQELYTWRFGFDLTKVRVLQEDLYRLVQRHDLAIRGGWEIVGEGRRALGLPVDDDRDNVFIRQINTATVDATPGQQPEEPTPPSPANGNGTGNGPGYETAEQVADAVVSALERRELTRT